MVHKIGTLHWRKGLQYAATYCKRNSSSLFVHATGALSFVGGQDYINQHLPVWWIRCTIAKDQALLCWPPRSPDLIPCDFFLWGYVKDLSLYCMYHRICLTCEDETSPPSQKLIVTCCSRFTRCIRKVMRLVLYFSLFNIYL